MNFDDYVKMYADLHGISYDESLKVIAELGKRGIGQTSALKKYGIFVGNGKE